MRLYYHLIAVMLLVSLTACTRDYPKVEDRDSAYVSFQFGILREQSPNSWRSADDPMRDATPTETDLDNLLRELRVIIFPTGQDQSIINHLATAQELTSRRVIFTLDKMAHYDFYFIANESAPKDNTMQSSLREEMISRAQLENMNDVQTILNNQVQGAGVDSSIMMTAVYKDVPVSEVLRGSGTESDPYLVDFTEWNKIQRPQYGIANRAPAELMRSLAKVELTLKDIVAIRVKPNTKPGAKAYEYSWMLPYGYDPNNYLLVEMLNMPILYTLFPANRLTDVSDPNSLSGTYYQYLFDKAPIEEYVIMPEIDEPSIGGIYMGDYKLYFYLPEYLASESLPLDQQPAIRITYRVETPAEERSSIYPMQNPSPADLPTDYETVLEGLPERPDYNIYRNRLYKISVNISGKELI